MIGAKGTRRLLAGLLALLVLAACASKKDVSSAEGAIPLEESQADSAPASDSDVFADLNSSEPKKVEIAEVSTDSSSEPFYSAVGGEKLGRVAYALYGSKRHSKLLRKQNPGIAGTLSQGQAVHFSFDHVDPRPMFFTKDLIERYPEELSKRIQGATTTAEVKPGETLQAVSQRLYGTTRYWTEIYLLNRDKISSFDKVSKGTALVVVNRPEGFDAYAEVRAEFGAAAASVAKASAPAVAAPVYTPPPMKAAVREPVREAPKVMEQPVAPAPVPEPVKEESLQAGVVDSQVVPPPAPKEAKPLQTMGDTTDQTRSAEAGMFSSTNIRRIIYVGLILIITVFAFYMTRPSKRQKFDMLDMTANSTASRPKLKDQGRDAG